MQWILTRKGFRRFVWLQLLLFFLVMVLEFVLDSCCNHPLLVNYNNAVENAFEGSVFFILVIVFLLALLVISTVGLLKLRDYGRKALLLSWGLGFVLLLLSGENDFLPYYTPYTAYIYSYLGALSGFELALVYFSPLKDEFK